MKCRAISSAVRFAGVLSLTLFLLGICPFSSGATTGKTRLAVIDFEQKGAQEFKGRQAGEIVAEWLITSLVRTGRFDVVERAQMQKILKEQQLGMTGAINQETAAKVGELLGVKFIITGTVIQFGSTVDVNARLINVEDGSILKAERLRGASLESVEGMMDSLADSLKKDFPIQGFVVLVSGQRAMIDVGRLHGVEPGMKFLVLRKGAPVRHPVTGKMLKGEDLKLGEVAVQSVETETSWTEILKEEPGIKIAAGNLIRYSGEEAVAVAPAPTAAPVPVQPVVKPVRSWTGKIRSAKFLVEWTGMNDLVLGDRDGYVTLYLNQGTKDVPRYDAGTKMKAGGKEIKVRSPSSPCVVDWNGDGKADLLVGNGGGHLHLFLNTGSGEYPPNFSAGIMVQAAGQEVNVGRRAAPVVVDWNEDGKKDLVVGNSSGEIFLYINQGTNEQPVFGKPVKLNGGSLDVGSNSSADFVDWNGDGKKDLVVGNSSGEILVFLNKGTHAEPQYDSKGEKLSLKFEADASPQILDRGGIPDLAVADRDGEVSLCANTGRAGAPSFLDRKVLRPGRK